MGWLRLRRSGKILMLRKMLTRRARLKAVGEALVGLDVMGKVVGGEVASN